MMITSEVQHTTATTPPYIAELIFQGVMGVWRYGGLVGVMEGLRVNVNECKGGWQGRMVAPRVGIVVHGRKVGSKHARVL